MTLWRAFFGILKKKETYKQTQQHMIIQEQKEISSLSEFFLDKNTQMSNDLEYRPSPPDFGDDENKDDDQMFKSATLPVTDDVPLSEDDDDNPFGEVREKSKVTSNLPAVAVPEQQSPVKEESQLFSADTGLHSLERNTSIGSLDNPASTMILNNAMSTQVTTDLKASKPRSEGYNIEIIVSDPTKVGEVRSFGILFSRSILVISRVCHRI